MQPDTALSVNERGHLRLALRSPPIDVQDKGAGGAVSMDPHQHLIVVAVTYTCGRVSVEAIGAANKLRRVRPAVGQMGVDPHPAGAERPPSTAELAGMADCASRARAEPLN